MYLWWILDRTNTFLVQDSETVYIPGNHTFVAFWQENKLVRFEDADLDRSRADADRRYRNRITAYWRFEMEHWRFKRNSRRSFRVREIHFQAVTIAKNAERSGCDSPRRVLLDYARFVAIRVLWFRRKRKPLRQRIDTIKRRVQIRRICPFALFANLVWIEDCEFWTVSNRESRIVRRKLQLIKIRRSDATLSTRRKQRTSRQSDLFVLFAFTVIKTCNRNPSKWRVSQMNFAAMKYIRVSCTFYL